MGDEKSKTGESQIKRFRRSTQIPFIWLPGGQINMSVVVTANNVSEKRRLSYINLTKERKIEEDNIFIWSQNMIFP